VENADGWKTVEGVHCPWKGMEDYGKYWKVLDHSGLVLSEFVPG